MGQEVRFFLHGHLVQTAGPGKINALFRGHPPEPRASYERGEKKKDRYLSLPLSPVCPPSLHLAVASAAVSSMK